ncbi:MAG TPA: hypothetical protein VFS72_00160 [Agromyces sp.]|nr:hypothetical protein [Agromyces sp.]
MTTHISPTTATRGVEVAVEQQLASLRAQLAFLVDRSPFYRERLDGIDPESIRALADLAAIPAFDKSQHRASQERSMRESGHPYGAHLTAGLDEVRYVNATSGTSGEPTFYTFTRRDAELNDEVLGRAFAAMGLRRGDTVLHAYALSMFVGGVPWLRALDRAGIRSLPVGAEGGTARLLTIAKLTRPTALFCTPSFAEHLIERAPEVIGAEVSSLGIRVIQCGGEPGAGDPAVRARIAEAYGAQVFDGMGGCWGHFMLSCEHQTGMHPMAPEHHLIELLDGETGAPLPLENGVVGQMTHTSLDWQAGPILRYNMGDDVQLVTDPCPCGRPGPRYRILGRADDMLIVNGINVHPAAVRDVVASFAPQVTGAIRVLAPGTGPRVAPPLRVRIEALDDPERAAASGLAESIEARIRDLLRFRATVEFVPAGSLGRSSHKTTILERTP